MKRKLTDEQVIQARQMYREGLSVIEISRTLGIGGGAASRMLRGITYSKTGGAGDRRCTAGVERRGSMSPKAILDENDVEQIRKMLERGTKCNTVAKAFNVSTSTIHAIARGRTWAHVGPPISLVKPAGASHPNAAISELTASYIKAHLLIGVASILLQRYFGVGRGVINGIARKTTWKHVEPHPNPPSLKEIAGCALPIRLRGKRLDMAFQEKQASLKEARE